MDTTYTPQPLDTSGVSLPEELVELRERLAANNHDVYAKRRIEEGWKYGPQRDDQKKTNPTLVPYEELPEIEKAYDRATVEESLKFLVAMGYRIVPPDVASVDTQEAYLKRAKSLWQQSGYLAAFDEMKRARELWPEAPLLIRYQAVCFNKLGVHEKAIQLLEPLAVQGDTSAETWGNLASAYKSLGLLERDVEKRKDLFSKAAFYYEQGFENGGRSSVWLSINAAMLACLNNDFEKVRNLATETRTLCEIQLSHIGETDERYWVLATIAEAMLLQGQVEEALCFYRQAAEAAPNAYGQFESTRGNARLIAEHLGVEWGPIDDVLHLPAVVVFTGHMLDAPNRKNTRFPKELKPYVAEALSLEVKRLNGGYAYTSLACGSDILFAEIMLECGGELNVVLPCAIEEFRRTSVDYAPGQGWGERFDRLLERAKRVNIVCDEPLAPQDPTYQYMNTVLLGQAWIRAKQLGTDLQTLAVWDGFSGDGPGGTADTVKLWQEKLPGKPVTWVNTSSLMREYLPDVAYAVKSSPSIRQSPPEGPTRHVQVMTLLFADVVGYSGMRERHIPSFVESFMRGIAEIIHASAADGDVTNSWGDAIYCAFIDPEEAGHIALKICDFVASKEWVTNELPVDCDLQIRISLHAGPVFECFDHIRKKQTYTGTHVSRTARIEPITPPNHVYASEAYAALLFAENVSSLICDYAGETKLAKAYGTFPLYHIRSAQ